ncbi:MAG: EF-P lysine aminoacylase EpmA [Methylococcales bacterium]
MGRDASPSPDWQPSCSIEHLRLRAQMLATIRRFFSERAVLEVETPLLSQTIGTDPQLEFFTTEFNFPPSRQTLYLQTSPEFAMKRLLASGSGSIYQICKAFRNGEAGRFHNPEFTMLEWYRVGFNLQQLMDEIADLIAEAFAGQLSSETQRISYQDVFKLNTGLDALTFDYQAYCAYALDNQLPEAIDICRHDHAIWLDFIFTHKVQPELGKNALCLVFGYPACQSSLARLNLLDDRVTERVELFINGVELGNGYYELLDANEQNQRFDREIAYRQQNNLPPVTKDHRLIQALEAGMPDCSGVAIGLDRLLMLLSNSASIDQVLGFAVGRA